MTRARTGPVDPRLWARTGPVRLLLVTLAVLGTALAGLLVAQDRLLASALGTVFVSRRAEGAVRLLPPLAAVFLARGLLAWTSGLVAHRAAATVRSRLRRDVLAARLSTPTATVDGDTLTLLLTRGLDALDGYVGRYLPQLVLATSVPLVVGTTLLVADWRSAVVVLATLPLVVVFMVLVGRHGRDRLERRWRAQARLAHRFADLVAGLPTLQVFGRARAQAANLQQVDDEHRRQTMLTLRTTFLSSLVLELVATLSVALVAVEVGLRVLEGRLDLTTALFVLVLAPEAFLALRQLGAHYHDSADGLAALDDAFGVVDAAVRPSGRDAVPDLARSNVELQAVSARHPGAAADSLHDLSLSLEPGEVVALAGPSGSGKSTALAVLLGFVAPTSGRVLVGGRDLAGLDTGAWRARLAWVPQAPALLAGTVGENVALGAPGASAAERRRALADAGASHLALDRVVGPGNEGLSVGEVRRVALARALLRVGRGGGRLLVMDEPTAGLDPATELAALHAVRALGVSALVVSHRPAVLAAADRVVTLEHRSAVAA